MMDAPVQCRSGTKRCPVHGCHTQQDMVAIWRAELSLHRATQEEKKRAREVVWRVLQSLCFSFCCSSWAAVDHELAPDLLLRAIFCLRVSSVASGRMPVSRLMCGCPYIRPDAAKGDRVDRMQGFAQRAGSEVHSAVVDRQQGRDQGMLSGMVLFAHIVSAFYVTVFEAGTRRLDG